MTSLPDSQRVELYQGLRALEETLFPKTCRVCGQEYRGFDDFVRKTIQIHGTSGLTCFEIRGKKLYVGLFRNCVCGSTLLVPCTDRRDDSPAAVKRRELFGKTLDLLKQQGWETEVARRELLRFMRGQKSKVLDSLKPAASPRPRQSPGKR